MLSDKHQWSLRSGPQIAVCAQEPGLFAYLLFSLIFGPQMYSRYGIGTTAAEMQARIVKV